MTTPKWLYLLGLGMFTSRPLTTPAAAFIDWAAHHFARTTQGLGYTYDSERDAFIPPKPYPSWLLNEDTCLWESPVPYPTDVGTEENPKRYTWDEEAVNWVEVTA
jgi:hypothetical protein